MYGYSFKNVNLKLSVTQEQQVVVASLKKHCYNIERELVQHALGNDSMANVDIADNLRFIDCATYVMRYYGE
jgi:hypothetical protein